MPADDSAPAAQRRPQDDDLRPLLELLWEGNSLRKACLELGLHVPSTSDWLHEDNGRREQYERARVGRAEFISEDAFEMSRAAALGKQHDDCNVDPGGVRAYLDAAKWRVGQMAPKMAPRTQVDVTSRTRQMTDEEIAAEIAALEAPESDGA
jgi:hypothetical protein